MQLETTDCYLHSTQEELSSPILKQLLDLGGDCKLFPETIRTSEVSSCSDNVVGGGQSGSSGSKGDIGGISGFEDAPFSSPFSSSSMDPYALAALLNGPDLEPRITTNCPPILPLPPLSSPMPALASLWNNLNDQFDPSNLVGNVNNGYVMSFSMDHAAMPQPSEAIPKLSQIPSAIPPPPIVFEGDSSMTLPGMDYISHDLAATTCSFLDPTGANMGVFFPGSLGMSISGDGTFKGNMSSGAEGLTPMPELADCQADFGGLRLFAPKTTSQQMAYGSTDTQVFADCQNIAGVCGSPTRLPSDVASLAESTFKIGRLSVEERKEKIHRYMKKRSERNFSKKIKYACRKTLADSRPRVRGRFAKNDEFEEAARPISSNHNDNDEDVMIKDEDLLDSSTIFAHLSSFRCNFTLESWI